MQKLGPVALLGICFAVGAVLVVTGCGEDGQGIREAGKCPAQPLYHYEFADSGGHWVARHASQVPPAPGTNTDLTPDEQTALDQKVAGATEPPGGGGRCLTPPGNAKTLDAGN